MAIGPGAALAAELLRKLSNAEQDTLLRWGG